jgi:hypothetical protein
MFDGLLVSGHESATNSLFRQRLTSELLVGESEVAPKVAARQIPNLGSSDSSI